MTDTTKTTTSSAPIAQRPGQDAGRDADIQERLESNPSDSDAKLDAGLDESMDGSDPPATLQPGDTGEPVPSSGYDPEAEKQLRDR